MKQRDILFLLICTCIFIFIWIGFSVYTSAFQSTISEDLNQQITSIKPDFNAKILDLLKDKTKAHPVFTFGGASSSATQVSVTPTPIPTTLPSPTPVLSPTKALPSPTGSTITLTP